MESMAGSLLWDKSQDQKRWCPAGDLNPHACATDPKSGVSAKMSKK